MLHIRQPEEFHQREAGGIIDGAKSITVVRRRSRAFIGAALVCATSGIGVGTSTAQADNSDAAHLCNQGGYAELAPADTPTEAFGSVGKCVSHHARGGIAVPVAPEPAAVCLNGGFANLARAATWWAEFTSQQECIDFIVGGGAVVDDRDPTVSIDIVSRFFHNAEGNCAFNVTGTGFLPGDLYLVGIKHNGWLSVIAGGWADENGRFVTSFDGRFGPQFVVGHTVQAEITEGVEGDPPIIVTSDVLTCTH